MVVHPFDRQRAVDFLSLVAKLGCWFHCDYFVAASCKFCCVAARARAYVKDSAGLHRKKVQQIAVNLSKGDALVLRG